MRRNVVATEEARKLAIEIAQAAAKHKIESVVALDVSDRMVFTDIFVIIGVSNERRVNAVVDEVDEAMLRRGVRAKRKEGTTVARWVLLDYTDVIVHIQHEEDREYYALEKLWGDCRTVAIPGLVDSGEGPRLLTEIEEEAGVA